MLVELVHAEVRAGAEAAFEAAFLEVRRRVAFSPGFRGLTVAQVVDLDDHDLGVVVAGSTGYVVRTLWESADDLAVHVRSRSARCWEPVDRFLARALRVEHLVERPGLAGDGPGTDADLDLAWLTG